MDNFLSKMDKKSQHRISKSDSLFVAEQIFEQSPRKGTGTTKPAPDTARSSPKKQEKKEILSILERYFQKNQ